MLDQIKRLEAAQAEKAELVSIDDVSNWKNDPVTKIFLLQLEIDLENIKENWIQGAYTPEQTIQSQAQALYIFGLLDNIAEGLLDDD